MYQSQRQEPCVPFLCRYAPDSVRGGPPATEHGTAHACRLEAFMITNGRGKMIIRSQIFYKKATKNLSEKRRSVDKLEVVN